MNLEDGRTACGGAVVVLRSKNVFTNIFTPQTPFVKTPY
ncbi:MAG: hypothetical protein ACJAYJ_002414 [Saprospiraceae bacterium]|jgi:hypothetical protein